MSWAWPSGHFSSGVIIDRDELNRSLMPYVWELNYLNEANWDRGAADNDTVMNQLRDDDKVDNDWGLQPFLARGTTALGKYDIGLLHTATETVLANGIGWTKVDDFDKDIVTKGGMFLIIASFQLKNSTQAGESAHQFCIGIDGQPRYESLIGSGDMGNDISHDKAGREMPLGASAVTFDPTAYTASTGIGPGIKSGQMGLTLRLPTYLPAGPVNIGLMSQAIYAFNGTPDQGITKRNLFIIRMNSNP